MPKRKSVHEIVAHGEWKSVEFKRAALTDEDDFNFEDLVEIEELTDYQIGNVEKPESEKIIPGASRQPSKKKMKTDAKREKRRLAKILAKAQKITEDGVSSEESLVGHHSATLEDRCHLDDSTEKNESFIDDAAELCDEVDTAADPIDQSKWEQLYVCPAILKALGDMAFAAPTPIQEACLPAAIRSRKDVVGAAETGSGKTLAFAIPIVQNIMEDKAVESDGQERRLRALIVTPTRELAVQIKKHITTVAAYTDVTTCLVVGGMFKEKQDRLLLKHPDIVIATPGRLFEHIQNQTPYLRDLTAIRYLVIDEADRMTERGHFHELTSIMEIIQSDERAVAKRQTFIFSATLSLELEALKKDADQDGRRSGKGGFEVEGDKITNLCSVLGLKRNAMLVDLSKPEGTAGGLLERRLPCTLKDKDYLFYYLLMTEATGRVIVFCNSLDCVRRLYGVFSYLLTESGRMPLVLHAGMHQKQRLKNLERFQAHPGSVLLASDVASRGLDIPDVQFVIHYQVPRKPDLYVHRSGRTARAFKVGCSVLLVDPSDAPASQKIISCLQRDRDFPLVEVDAKVLRFAKERVDLARKIDLVEHSLRKESSKDEWYLKAAQEADLEMEKDDRRKLDIQKETGKSLQSKEAKQLKRVMKALLARPLKSRMPGFSHQYPTLNFAKTKLGLS